jgi:hypothetical protein
MLTAGELAADIEVQKGLLLEQANATGYKMNVSMFIAASSFTAPLKFLITKVYVVWTKRRYDWQIGDQIDTFAFGVSILWFYIFYDFRLKDV